jgi:hypothetical protein
MGLVADDEHIGFEMLYGCRDIFLRGAGDLAAHQLLVLVQDLFNY